MPRGLRCCRPLRELRSNRRGSPRTACGRSRAALASHELTFELGKPVGDPGFMSRQMAIKAHAAVAAGARGCRGPGCHDALAKRRSRAHSRGLRYCQVLRAPSIAPECGAAISGHVRRTPDDELSDASIRSPRRSARTSSAWTTIARAVRIAAHCATRAEIDGCLPSGEIVRTRTHPSGGEPASLG